MRSSKAPTSRQHAFTAADVPRPFAKPSTSPKLSHRMTSRLPRLLDVRMACLKPIVSARPSVRTIFSARDQRPRQASCHESKSPMTLGATATKAGASELPGGCRTRRAPEGRGVSITIASSRASFSLERACFRALMASSTSKRHFSLTLPSSRTVFTSMRFVVTPQPPQSTPPAPSASVAVTSGHQGRFTLLCKKGSSVTAQRSSRRTLPRSLHSLSPARSMNR